MYTRTHELPTFLGESVPVEFAARLEGFEVDGSAVTLRCATNRYEPYLHDYYGTVCETTFAEPTPGEPAALRLDFLTPDILRLRYAPGAEVPENETPMVVGGFGEPVDVQVDESDATVTLRAGDLSLVVDREPLRLRLVDGGGKVVWDTKPVDIEPLRRPEHQWNPAEQRWIFMHRYAYPLGVARDGTRKRAFASFGLRHDERVYGFGESYGPLDKRGTHQKLWLQEVFSNAVPAAYKQAPFYLSSRGYGMYVNTSNALGFRVGELEHTALSVAVEDATFLDFYVIHGPGIKEILPRYHAITGRPAVPPKWTFGLWMGRISYNRQDQVEEVARELREHRIPCDLIHIDTDWYERDWECDYRFGKSKFPDPAGMMEKLKEQGFRVCLWQWPNMIVGTETFEEGQENGYLAKRVNGHPYIFPGFEKDAGFIDYSNPEAVRWVQGKFKSLFELGVACIKADFGEGAPPYAVYENVPSESMHNLYPLLYNKAVFEATEEFWGEGRGVIWGRSAWAGSQRYPVHWSGDGIARFEDLACVLRSMLSFGLTGFPFYSHDIGGFSGVPSPELFVRWAQLGLFTSHARCHGVPPREPWAYGEKAEAIFRKYDELRYRLMPYIWSEALECGATGLPMVRPLFLEYPDDPTTHAVDDQYLFGNDLLVVPILDEGEHRRVYLPHGTWVDYHTKEVLEGGRWLEVRAPLDTLPLYVRGGAILPHGPLVQHTGERPFDPLTIELYAPEDAGGYTVRDEGRPDVPVSYRRNGDKLTVEAGAAPGRVEVVVYGADVSEAAAGDESLDIGRTDDGGARIAFNGTAARTVTLRLSSAV